MKEVVFILEGTYEYEEVLKEELKQKGYYVNQNAPDFEDFYVITDCEKGINIAKGYIFYETEFNRDIVHKNCQCIIQGFQEIDADFVLKMYQRYKKIPWIIAQTDRLIIREQSIADIPNVIKLYEDEEISRYAQNFYKDLENLDKNAFEEAYIETMYGIYGFGMWLLISKRDETIIGRAGLTFREGYECLEIGYSVKKSERRKGYAYEACKEIMKIAKENYDCSTLNCFIEEKNIPSAHLAQKLGFRHKAILNIDGKDYIQLEKTL